MSAAYRPCQPQGRPTARSKIKDEEREKGSNIVFLLFGLSGEGSARFVQPPKDRPEQEEQQQNKISPFSPFSCLILRAKDAAERKKQQAI